jgi:hypothetical protein
VGHGAELTAGAGFGQAGLVERHRDAETFLRVDEVVVIVVTEVDVDPAETTGEPADGRR